ncbi:MAG: hypothetical protein EZS28_005168 [Streblomastix strix]|uniref:Protein kinase domain-containing protein n=1 Tax=Streblomastix strix TaxID=222440 RepID=A0A5J4WWB2_9EUKA|nr:MAG: hypothetical protein EZS28_005168 [Streblomastix strix]
MIHKLGLIHRNIKAENILMHSSNGSIKVKIADFETVQTAPEIILNYQVITNKVDMWSYGVVLFQLATHEYPIKAKTNHKFQKKMRHMKSIERPLEIKDDILWDLISKLLEFDPIKRLSAAEALLHPFFTSPQALAEISDASRIIAANYIPEY